jgi:hypothetical protein
MQSPAREESAATSASRPGALRLGKILMEQSVAVGRIECSPAR